MPRFSVRPVIPTDIPELVTMIHALAAFHGDTGTATIESVTRDTSGPAPWWHTFVAEADRALIGYMVLLPKSKVAEGLRGMDINHMYVHHTHRGTGVGRALIETARGFAQAQACTYLMIGTAEQNTAAQAAYLACGFEDARSNGGPRFRMQL